VKPQAARRAARREQVDGVDGVSEALGSRIRRERLEAGLTVRGLAARIAVSPSLISQIERGLARPSVATLFLISNTLGIPIAELFAEDEPPQDEPVAGRHAVQRSQTRKTMTLAQGVRWERLTAEPDEGVDFVYLDYPPGASSSEGSLRSHKGREFGYVLEGSLRVRIGDEEHELQPGDSISFDSTTPHELVAGDDEPMRAIWFVVNRSDDPRVEPFK
jgi:transcriptional regulator with XRE-family HTH domain